MTKCNNPSGKRSLIYFWINFNFQTHSPCFFICNQDYTKFHHTENIVNEAILIFLNIIIKYIKIMMKKYEISICNCLFSKKFLL